VGGLVDQIACKRESTLRRSTGEGNRGTCPSRLYQMGAGDGTRIGDGGGTENLLDKLSENKC